MIRTAAVKNGLILLGEVDHLDHLSLHWTKYIICLATAARRTKPQYGCYSHYVQRRPSFDKRKHSMNQDEAKRRRASLAVRFLRYEEEKKLNL